MKPLCVVSHCGCCYRYSPTSTAVVYVAPAVCALSLIHVSVVLLLLIVATAERPITAGLDNFFSAVAVYASIYDKTAANGQLSLLYCKVIQTGRTTSQYQSPQLSRPLPRPG